jgi:hypothetical protein
MSDTIVGGASAHRAAMSLARVEGRHIVRHPLFGVGLSFVLVGIVVFVRTATSETRITWDDDAWMVAVGFYMLAIFVMITTNLAALRDRREHTTEQLRAAPLGQSARTAGLITSVAWPAAVAFVLFAGTVAFAATETTLTSSDRVHLLAVVVMVGLLGVLGVTLAVWIPTPFVAPLVAWGTMLIVPNESTHGWQALSILVDLNDVGLALWHVAYLVGLTGLCATAALARSGWSRGLVVFFGVVVAIAGTSAWVLVTSACPSGGACRF